MDNDLAVPLKDLPSLERPELFKLRHQVFRKRAHPKLRRDLMIPALAYGLQYRAFGGLKPVTQNRLHRLAEELEHKTVGRTARRAKVKPGTKLVRYWKNQPHEVIALADGFEYRGRRYGSLSDIARHITGTRWSGPAFFGLKQRTKQEGKK